jgi:hypothetical protein
VLKLAAAGVEDQVARAKLELMDGLNQLQVVGHAQASDSLSNRSWRRVRQAVLQV